MKFDSIWATSIYYKENKKKYAWKKERNKSKNGSYCYLNKMFCMLLRISTTEQMNWHFHTNLMTSAKHYVIRVNGIIVFYGWKKLFIMRSSIVSVYFRLRPSFIALHKQYWINKNKIEFREFLSVKMHGHNLAQFSVMLITIQFEL